MRLKFRAKVGQNVTSTGIIINANVSKDTMYGIQLRGFTSPAISCYQIITTTRLSETGL